MMYKADSIARLSAICEMSIGFLIASHAACLNHRSLVPRSKKCSQLNRSLWNPYCHLVGCTALKPLTANMAASCMCGSQESFNFMKSSSIVSKKPPLLEKALSLAPAELIRRLSALLEGCDDKKRPSGAWKRKIQSILEPTRECYEALCVEDVNGGSVRFSCGLLSHMLAYICDACSWYQQRFAIISDRPVGLLLFGDEATGGNVLCTASSKKMWLFHLAFPQLGELHRPDSWLPLAAIPHRDVVNVKGGLSRCFASILHSLKKQLASGVHLCGKKLDLYIHGFLGDYDGIKSCFCSKGAAATKPCLMCCNVLSKEHVAAAVDSYFHTISSSAVENFQLTQSEELWSLYDKYLADLPGMSRSKQKDVEKLLGFALDPDSLLADKEIRQTMSLSRCLLDSCHCYYANGICAQELALVVEFLSKSFNVHLTDLQQLMTDIPWMCRDPRLCAKSAKRHLFHDALWSGPMYKGSASEVWHLLPWMWYHVKLLADSRTLPEVDCLEALMEAPVYA